VLGGCGASLALAGSRCWLSLWRFVCRVQALLLCYANDEYDDGDWDNLHLLDCCWACRQERLGRASVQDTRCAFNVEIIVISLLDSSVYNYMKHCNSSHPPRTY
jgi:hypothetical protein